MNVIEFPKAVSVSEGKLDDNPCWLIPDWLMLGRMTALRGASGAGKSTLAIRLAAAATTCEWNWLATTPENLNGKPKAVVFASWTEPLNKQFRRLMYMDMSSSWNDKLYALELIGHPPLIADGELTPIGKHVISECERLRARLLVLDPAPAAFGSKRDFAHANAVGEWARENDCAILILDSPQDGLPDWPLHVIWRLQWNSGEARIKCIKNKFGPKPAPLTLHGEDPVKWKRLAG